MFEQARASTDMLFVHFVYSCASTHGCAIHNCSAAICVKLMGMLTTCRCSSLNVHITLMAVIHAHRFSICQMRTLLLCCVEHRHTNASEMELGLTAVPAQCSVQMMPAGTSLPRESQLGNKSQSAMSVQTIYYAV